MLGASRTPNCQLQGKATRTAPAVVSSHASRRVTRRRAQAFKGSRRALVTVAAAESEAPATPAARAPRKELRPLTSIEANEVVEGRVTSVQSFGAFVDIGAESQGLIHVSQLADGFVRNVGDVIKVGETVKVKVLSVDVAGKRLALTRKGLWAGGPAASTSSRRQQREEEEDVEEDELAVDPNVAELDGLIFIVEDEDEEATGDIDPAELEFVDELDPDVAREIAIACEDIVNGTVVDVNKTGVTVSYTLEDGTDVEGLIHVSELLAPSHLVEQDGEAAADEAEEYSEVDNIDPTAFYKVGDKISCFVMDVEAGTPLLTQRLPEEADDELAALAEVLEEQEPDSVSDALLIEGLWAAAEDAAGGGVDDDEDENGDVLLEVLDPAEGAVAAADDDEDDGYVSAVPEEVRLEVLGARGAGASRSDRLLQAGMQGMRLPDRSVGVDASSALSATLLEQFNSEVEEDEAEFLGVSVNDTSYVPRSLLKKLGYKIVKSEETEEWQVVRREGAEEAEELDESLADELAAVSSGLYNARQIDAIVKELMTDEEADEAELPRLARRNPVVAAAAVSANISAAAVSALRKKTGAGMMDCKKALTENGGDADKAVEWLRQKGLSGADKKAGRIAAEGAIVRYIHPGSRLGVLLEVNCETDFVAAGDVFTTLAGELAMVVASSEVVCVSVDDMPPEVLAKEREVEMGKEDLKSKPEAVRAKIVEGRLEKIKKNFALLEQPALRDNNKTVGEIIKEGIAATGENIQVRRFVKYNLGEGLEKRSNDFAAEVAQQTQAKAAEPATPKKEEPKAEQPKQEPAKPAVQISAGLVKQLRDKSGAGMMDCKKALAENAGDIEAASEWLRKKGLASADKKAGRLAAEGAVLSYIHPGSRLGVLLEVNCETDFVAAGEVFNKLANTVAMQVAASPTVEYVSSEEIPADVFEREKEIEMGREDLQSKPEAIRAKIAEGRVKKLVQERVLLEQPYLLDQNKTVAEAVKEAIAACGENIQVRRFSRFVLGEGMEKKESNLAAEVAAATGGKA